MGVRITDFNTKTSPLSALDRPRSLVFCGLLALLVWLLRKGRLTAFGLSGAQSQGAGQLDVIARRTLTAQHTLHLVSQQVNIPGSTHPHGLEIASLPARRKLNRLPVDSERRKALIDFLLLAPTGAGQDDRFHRCWRIIQLQRSRLLFYDCPHSRFPRSWCR